MFILFDITGLCLEYRHYATGYNNQGNSSQLSENTLALQVVALTTIVGGGYY